MRANFTRILFSTLFFVAAYSFGISQTAVLMDQNAKTVTGCDFVLYDDGGPNGPYGDDIDRTLTICSPNGEQIRLDFSYLEIDNPFDDFYIYDGPNTASDQIYLSSAPGMPDNYNPQIIVSSGSCITIRLDNFASNSGANRGWEIFASCFTPPCEVTTPAGNTCQEATPICSNAAYCGSTRATYTDDTPGNLENSFCGSIENNSFLSFTAAGPNAVFEVAVWGCTGSSNGSREGVQFQVYETNDCVNYTTAGTCFNPGIEQGGTFTATGLTFGNQYYIMIDGFAGDNCDYTIQAISGVQLPSNAGEDIVACGPSTVQLNGSVNPPNSAGYEWRTEGDGTFNNPNILNAQYTPGPNDIANGMVQLVLFNPSATACLDIKTDTVLITFKDIIVDITPSDPAICLGESVTLTANSTPTIPSNSTKFYENTNSNTIPDDGVDFNFNGNTGNYGSSPLDVDCLNPSDWQLTQYCVNSNSDQTTSLEGFFLVNPCGNVIRIANDNAIINGCFAPGTNAAWTAFLNCANPNGIWEVRSGDSDPFGDVHNITNFSLTFNSSNFQWSPATGLNTTIGNQVIATPTQTTTYQLQAMDCEAGCTLIEEVTVRVSDMLLTGSGTNIQCNGADNGSVTISATGGIAPYEYSIDNGANYQTTNTFNNLQPGSYTVLVRDAAGCTKMFTQVISEPPVLNFNATAASNCVAGNAGEINATASGGSTPYMFSIDGTNFQASGNFTGVSFGNYTVSVRDAQGCTEFKNIVIEQKPVPTFNVLDPSCNSLQTSLTTDPTVGTASLTGSGIGLITFNNPPNNSQSFNPGIGFNVNSSNYGTFTIKYKVTNGNCSDSLTQDVTFIESPVADFDITAPSCGDVSTLINVNNPIGTANFTITPNDGSTINPTANANEFQFNAAGFTQYSITLSLDNNGCTDNISKTVEFLEIPNPQITPTADVCGLNTNLSAMQTNSGNFVQWFASGPGVSNFGNRNSANTSVSVTAYGTYQFRFNEAGPTGCPSVEDTIEVTFFEMPSGNAGMDTSVCDAIPHNLNGTVNVGNGRWTSGLNISNPNNLKSAINPGAPGTYTYTLTITNGVCAPLVDDVVFTIDEKPVINFTPDVFEVCGFDTPLNGVATVGTTTWESKNLANIDDPSAVNTSATNSYYGVNTFYFTASNGSCANVKDSIEITFEEAPNAMATAVTPTCGDSVILNATYSLPANDGFWTGPGVFTPSTTVSNPTVKVNAFGTYTFTWTENGTSVCPAETIDIPVEFVEQPIANAGLNQQICGTMGTLTATASSGTGTWTSIPVAPASGTITIDSPNSPVTDISVDTNGVGEDGYGRYLFIWSETNTAACMVSTDTVEVYFVPDRGPIAGLDQMVCGDTAFLNVNNAFESGAWSFQGPGGNIIFSDRTDPKAIASLDPANFKYGTYRFVWIEGLSPCSPNNRDTVFIEYFEPPVADAGVSPDQVCGLNAQLSAGVTVGKGKWSWIPISDPLATITFENGNDSIPNPRITASDYGSFTLYYNVQNGVCMAPTDSIEFTFFERPTPTATAPADVCSVSPNQSFNLDGVASSGILWEWDGPPGVTFNPDANTPNVTADVVNFGTYKFFFSEINHPVCGIVRDSITVEVLEQPEVDAGNDGDACGDTYQLQAAITKGMGIGTWTVVDPQGFTVNFSDINDPNALVTVSPAPTVVGQFIDIQFEVVSGTTCLPVSDVVRVTFAPSTTIVDAGRDTTICGDLTFDLLASSLQSGETGIWTQDGGSGTASFVDATDPNTTVTVDEYDSYRFRWSVSNPACPNPSVDLVNIDFRRIPTPNAGPDEEICGLSIPLSANSLLGRITGFWSYVDDGNGSSANFSSLINPLATVTMSGDSAYGIQQFVWNNFNGIFSACADTVRDTVIVTFYEAPIADAGNDLNICGVDGKLFADTSISTSFLNGYSSNWEYIPSGGQTVIFTPNNQTANPDVTLSNTGRYQFEWIERNGVCPETRDTMEFFFVPSAQPEAGMDVDLCDLTATIQSTPSFGQGQWILDSLVPHSFLNEFAANTELTVSRYGNYRVIWRELNSPCPANEDTLIVQFNEAPNTKSISPRDYCGEIGELITTPSIVSPNLTGVWSTTSAVNLLTPNNDTTLAQLTNGNYGEYNVIYTENNGATCPPSFASTKINFVEEPVTNAGIDTVICGRILNMYATSSVGIGSWSTITTPPGGTVAFQQPSNPNTRATASTFGIYTLVWRETNNGKYGLTCTNSDTVVVEFLQTPTVTPIADRSVCGDNENLIATPTVAGSTITWEYLGALPGINVNSGGNPSIAEIGSNYGIHNFQKTESNRKCIATDIVAIEFIEQPSANVIPDYDTCGFRGLLKADPIIAGANGTWVYLGNDPNVNIPASNSLISDVNVSQYGPHSFIWQVENKTPCTIARDTLVINFIQPPVAKVLNDFAICSDKATLTATPSVGTGMWTSNDADPVIFSDPTSPTTNVSLVAPSAPQYHTYTFYWTETNGGKCVDTDSVLVTFSQQPSIDAGMDASTCGLEYTLTAATGPVGTTKWTYIGNPLNFGGFSDDTNDTTDVEVFTYGVHRFRAIQNGGGACPQDTSIIAITFFENPLPNAGADDQICGFDYELKAIASRGTGTWTLFSGPGNANFTDINDPGSGVTVDAEGEYVFVWSETNGICGPFTDTVRIFLEEQPNAIAGQNITICDIQVRLGATPTRFPGMWSLVSGPDLLNSSFSDVTDPNAQFIGGDFGRFTMIWTESNPAGMNCLPSSDTLIVNLVQEPNATTEGDLEACSDTIILNANRSVGISYWKQISGPGTVAFADSSQNDTKSWVENFAFGDYRLAWIEDNGGACPISSDTITVRYIEQPIVDAGSNRDFCGLSGQANGSVNVGALAWTLVNGPGSVIIYDTDKETTNIDVTDYGTYTFMLRSTNGNLCTDESTVDITFIEQPIADAGSDDLTCGLTYNLNAVFSSGTSGTWDANVIGNPGSSIFSNPTNNQSSVTVDVFGTYKFVWTESNNAVCTPSKDTVSIEFVEQPQINLGPDTVVCGDSVVLFSGNPVGTGMWSSTNPEISFEPSADADTVIARSSSFGTFEVTYTSTNKAPCIAVSDSRMITYIDQPKVSITVPDTVCTGGNVTVEFTFTGVAPFDVTFSLNGNLQTLNNVNSGAQYTFSNVTTSDSLRILQVTDGSPSSCPLNNPTAKFVEVIALPTATISGNKTVCFGDSAYANVFLSGFKPFTVTYSNGDVITYNSTDSIFGKDFFADESITITSVTDFYCSNVGIGSFDVTINELPDAQFSLVSPSQICEGETLDIQFTALAGQPSFDVSFILNTNDTIVRNNVNPGDIISIMPPVGSNTIKLITVSDNNTPKCSNSFGANITFDVTASPKATITAPTDICEGEAFNIDLSFTGEPNFDIAYTIDGVSNVVSNVGATYTLVVNPVQDLTVTIDSISDGSNKTCVTVIDEALSVHLVPQPEVTTSVDVDEVCVGETITYIINVEGEGPFDITYDVGNGNQTINGSNGIDSIVVTAQNSENFVVVDVQDASGLSCPIINAPAIPVTVNPIPAIDFMASEASGCKPFIVAFEPSVTLGQEGGSYMWTSSNGDTSFAQTPTFIFANSGEFDITLFYTTPSGCSNTLSKSSFIVVNPDPVANFQFLPELPTVTNNNIQFTNTSEGATAYYWIFDEFGESNLENPLFIAPNDDQRELQVCLEATNQFGCIDTVCDFIRITGDDLVYVPNTFTPNNDGINDLLYLSAQGVEDFKFEIFNRWGEKIFETEDPKDFWDGNYKGEIVQEGVYPYIVTYKDKFSVDVQILRGHVNVLK